MKKGVWVLSIVLSLLGCKEDPAPNNAAGAGGMAAGGFGGVGGGAAGAIAGVGGSMAGAGGTGAAGSGDGAVPGCSAAMAGDPAALHAAAAAVLTTMSPCMPDQACPCGSSSCHGGRGKANLVLVGSTNLNMTLVGVTSCEAPNLSLVASGGGDAALNNSWLWLKLTAPADASGNLTPNAAWGTSGPCDRLTPAMSPYGTRMPQAGTAMVQPESRLAPIRNWICAGAPGP